MDAPKSFRRIPSDRLRRLRDRYGECLARPGNPRCPHPDYVRAVLGETDAALTAKGEVGR